MSQRKRFGLVLLVAGLASIPSRHTPAQTPSAPPPAGATLAEVDGPRQVIATTRSTRQPFPSGEAPLPPPDDGLSPPRPKGSGKAAPSEPRQQIQRVGYVAPPPQAAEAKPTAPSVPKAAEVKPTAPVASMAGEAGPPAPAVPESPEGRGDQGEWSKAASLSVLVSGPENVAPGRPVARQIRVKNRGAQVLAEVGVLLPIPPGARIVPSDADAERREESLVWKLTNLQPNQERVLRLGVEASAPGEVRLRPRATFGTGGGPHSAVVPAPIVPPAGPQTAVVPAPLSLSVTGPQSATLGETVVFTVKVGNRTDSPIANVNLLGKLSEGLTHALGQEVTMDFGEPLLPGQVRSVQIETTVHGPGRHEIVMNATGVGGHRATASCGLVVGETGLTLQQNGPRQGKIGDVLTYRLEVHNRGRKAVGPLRLSQALPEGVGFGSASTAGAFEAATQSIHWTLPSLQPGERQSVTFAARCRKSGDWAMPAAATASGVAEARCTQALRIDSVPMASLTLKTQDDRLALNGETVCEVRLYNQGPTAMRDARLAIRLPESLQAVGIEGPTRWQLQGGMIVFEPMAVLAPRVDAIYRLRVRVVSRSNATIVAELSAAGLDKPQQALRAIQITGPSAGR